MPKRSNTRRRCSGHCYVWTRADVYWATSPGHYLVVRCAHCGWITKILTKYKAEEHDKLVSGSTQGYRNVHERGPCPSKAREEYKEGDDDEF
jgi:hypothetical protein